MTKEEALEEALKVTPKYPQDFCGCGEGWQDERCDKFTDLMNDGCHHCIFERRSTLMDELEILTGNANHRCEDGHWPPINFFP